MARDLLIAAEEGKLKISNVALTLPEWRFFLFIIYLPVMSLSCDLYIYQLLNSEDVLFLVYKRKKTSNLEKYTKDLVVGGGVVGGRSAPRPHSRNLVFFLFETPAA